MLKNILTKKLYQYLVILFILLFPIFIKAASWEEIVSSDSIYKTVKNDLLGRCIVQLRAAPLTYAGMGPSLGSVFYSPYGGSLNQPTFKNFCATVKPHILKIKLPYNPLELYTIDNNYLGPEIAIKNDDGVVTNFELYYGPININQLGGLDSGNAYTTSGGKSAFEKCKEANKNSVAALNLDYEVTGYFENLEQCKNHLLATVDIPIRNVESDGPCYKLVPLQSGQRAIASYNGTAISGIGSGWERCQCTTFGSTGQGVFYIDGNGNVTEYASTTVADKSHTGISGRRERWTIAAQKCINEHPIQFYNSASGGCFNDINTCKQASCIENDRDKYLLPGTNTFVTFQALIASGSVSPGDSVQRCDCSVAHNPFYTPLLCASGLPGAVCNETCKVVPGTLSSNPPIEPLSPLAFINVLANFLFWFAVILFVVNFVTAGLEMVRSGDEPEKMKEATERITSSIFGFIFVLIASGLINYLIDFLNDYIQ